MDTRTVTKKRNISTLFNEEDIISNKSLHLLNHTNNANIINIIENDNIIEPLNTSTDSQITSNTFTNQFNDKLLLLFPDLDLITLTISKKNYELFKFHYINNLKYKFYESIDKKTYLQENNINKNDYYLYHLKLCCTAASYGCINIIEFLRSTLLASKSLYLEQFGSKPFLEYTNYWDNEIYNSAAKNNQLETLVWLFAFENKNRFHWTDTNIYEIASHYGHLCIIKWVLSELV